MELKSIFFVVAIMTCFVVYVEYKTMGEDMQGRMGRAFDVLVANNTRLQQNINKLQSEYSALQEWKESAEKKIQNLENKVDNMQNTLASNNNNNNNSNSNSNNSSNNNNNNNNNGPNKVEEIKEKKSYKLAIGILTRHEAKDRRDVIRETWLRLLDGNPKNNFTYKFVVGQIPDKPEQYQKTIEENKTTGDILFIDSIDSYYNISYKSMEIFRWATEDLNTEFVFKTDDDTFLRIDKLIDDLDTKPKERFYGGHSIGHYTPHRDPGSQWYVPVEEYPKSLGPVLLSGSGYLLSKDCAAFLAQKSHEPNIKYIRLEDVNTMNLLEQMGVGGAHLEGYLFLGGCDNNMIMSHYRSSDEMKTYYNNIKAGVNVCPAKKRSIETADPAVCSHPITVNY